MPAEKIPPRHTLRPRSVLRLITLCPSRLRGSLASVSSTCPDSGCPWRDDPSNCTIPFLPGVGQSGLYQIIAAFNDAVVKTLTRYGSSRDQWPDDWKGKAGDTQKFRNVTLNWDMYNKILTDVKLQFVLNSFEGDVSQGLSLISQILEDEAFRHLDNGVRDNNTLYAVHVSFLNIVPPSPESV